jgi:hypothetical protein
MDQELPRHLADLLESPRPVHLQTFLIERAVIALDKRIGRSRQLHHLPL